MSHKMKRIILLTLTTLAVFSLSAQTSREEIDANPRIVVPTMTTYTGEIFTSENISAPKGYKPVFITGYMRHGSRFESDPSYPLDTYRYFTEADKAGLLTPLGKQVKEFMIWNYEHHQDRIGDLSTVGFEQHRNLAKRYAKRLPSLFKGDAKVASVASTSLRAAMSMVGFNQGLKELNPRLNNSMEASERTVGIIRPQKAANNKLYPAEQEKMYKSFLKDEINAKLVDWGSRQDLSHAHKALFTDAERFFAMFPEKKPFKIMTDIYKRMAFAQNFGKLDRTLIDEVFTADERYIIYKHENCAWHYRCGSAAHPILANNMWQSHILVDYIVEQVEAHISGKCDANAHFIFGHDLNLIPLQNIFGLENMPLYFGKGNENVDYVAEHWRGYKITPKAANIMFVIYRNKEGKILVRPLLNERDVELPIKSVAPHFYEWNEVKKLAYSRIAELDRIRKAK